MFYLFLYIVRKQDGSPADYEYRLKKSINKLGITPKMRHDKVHV